MACPGPDCLPAPPSGGSWPPEVERWWAAWCESPQVETWAPSDWSRLAMLAPLVAAYWASFDPDILARVVEVESTLGATGSDRAGLGVLRDELDPDSNRFALELTLEALASDPARDGFFDPARVAQVQQVRLLAAACDLHPSNSALWRQYRDALRELVAGGGSSPGADILAGLRGATVRDSPPA